MERVMKVADWLAALTTVFIVLYTVRFFDLFSDYFEIFPMGFVALTSGLILAQAFLRKRTTKSGENSTIPWYDLILAGFSILVGAYVMINAERIVTTMGLPSAGEIVLGFAAILLFMEGARRTVGLALTIIAAIFVAYAFLGSYIPGPLNIAEFGTARIIGHLYLFSDGMYGVIARTIVTMVAVYMLFAQFLTETGLGKFIIDISNALVGNVRGGPAKIAIFASAGFGMISGSAVGNVATTGVFTIPLMKKLGYRAEFAGAVEAVASTGGAIMPPIMGTVAFIMADMLSVPYRQVITMAIIPALLYYMTLFIQVDLEAAKLNLVGIEREKLPDLRSTLLGGWYYAIPMTVFFVELLWFKNDAILSALITIAALIISNLLFGKEKLNLKKIYNALKNTVLESMVSIIGIAGAAGCVVAVVSLTGLGVKLSGFLVDVSNGSLLLLLLFTAIVNYILGMGLPWSASFLLLVVLVAPALEAAGVEQTIAYFFILWTGLYSFITWPVAVAGYVASSIAESNVAKTCLTAMRLAMASYIIPFAMIFNRGLVMQGGGLEVLHSVVTAIVGLGVGAIGFSGYFDIGGKLTRFERALYILGGILLAASTNIVLEGVSSVMILTALTKNWSRHKTLKSEASIQTMKL
ncbi:TRAP transporter permease [Paradesulfitobacterium ferrireducens]|uniref:TRAP transporter permease n=1 Tax=Paradesulfitobacterium ferrireducens TaxID=2816476 RepID=UPI001F3D7A05|nr:TRAP transporter fused permease subunit [Paradesulfitobacterium ferrireducens]